VNNKVSVLKIYTTVSILFKPPTESHTNLNFVKLTRDWCQKVKTDEELSACWLSPLTHRPIYKDFCICNTFSK